MAHGAGMPRQAPAARSTPAGDGAAWIAGTTMYSAAVPNGRPRAPLLVPTTSPTRSAVTPGTHNAPRFHAQFARDHRVRVDT